MLKARLTAHESMHWTTKLPIVHLMVRNRVKPDIGQIPVESVYSTSLRLAGEYFYPAHSEPRSPEPVAVLRETIGQLQYTSGTNNGTRKTTFVPQPSRPHFRPHQRSQTASSTTLRGTARSSRMPRKNVQDTTRLFSLMNFCRPTEARLRHPRWSNNQPHVRRSLCSTSKKACPLFRQRRESNVVTRRVSPYEYIDVRNIVSICIIILFIWSLIFLIFSRSSLSDRYGYTCLPPMCLFSITCILYTLLYFLYIAFILFLPRNKKHWSRILRNQHTR